MTRACSIIQVLSDLRKAYIPDTNSTRKSTVPKLPAKMENKIRKLMPLKALRTSTTNALAPKATFKKP